MVCLTGDRAYLEAALGIADAVDAEGAQEEVKAMHESVPEHAPLFRQASPFVKLGDKP